MPIDSRPLSSTIAEARTSLGITLAARPKRAPSQLWRAPAFTPEARVPRSYTRSCRRGFGPAKTCQASQRRARMTRRPASSFVSRRLAYRAGAAGRCAPAARCAGRSRWLGRARLRAPCRRRSRAPRSALDDDDVVRRPRAARATPVRARLAAVRVERGVAIVSAVSSYYNDSGIRWAPTSSAEATRRSTWLRSWASVSSRRWERGRGVTSALRDVVAQDRLDVDDRRPVHDLEVAHPHACAVD